MYTWSYIKNAALAKLDFDKNETDITGDDYVSTLLNRFPYFANEAITQICSTCKPKHTFAEFIVTDDNVGTLITMPNDFVSFGDDMCYELRKECYCDRYYEEELFSDDFSYIGYNQVRFNHTGKFYISYNARWIVFTEHMSDEVVLNVPTDVLECLPSYIASQCYKVDDEVKAQIFRNEFEMLLSRIDDTDYKRTTHIKIGGEW